MSHNLTEGFIVVILHAQTEFLLAIKLPHSDSHLPVVYTGNTTSHKLIFDQANEIYRRRNVAKI